jgi:hypothetical protein
VTERLLLAQYLLAQYLRQQAHWRLDTVDGSPLRAANCVLALIAAAAYVRELPGDDPCVAALAMAGCFAKGGFEPGTEARDFIRRWQFVEQPSAGPRDLLSALAARCAASPHAALLPPQRRAPDSEPEQIGHVAGRRAVQAVRIVLPRWGGRRG